MSFQDPWPVDYDGRNLFCLLNEGRSPFAHRWDVNLLIREVEEKLATKVTDIPCVSSGSNNYGFHFKLSNRPDVLARLARGDVNMPDYDGFTIEWQVPEVKFEAETYALLRSEPAIRASHLLYHRVPVEYPPPHSEIPTDIAGRRLLLFECAEGVANIPWRTLTPDQKNHILTQAATIRAALFNFNPPTDFINKWFLPRLFEQKPASLPIPPAPTRAFCLALFTSKIHATIRHIGDMIGWPSDNEVVGPRAAAAKQSLLRLIPHILPQEAGAAAAAAPHTADAAAADSNKPRPVLYRLVLEHGDFGIHNMSITPDTHAVTSLFDWETGCFVPAMLSDPLMAVAVDLTAGVDGAPDITRVGDDATQAERAEYMRWAQQYVSRLYAEAPDYEGVIRAGVDARYLWFALRGWKGEDPEGFFGGLGEWAERRLGELGELEGN